MPLSRKFGLSPKIIVIILAILLLIFSMIAGGSRILTSRLLTQSRETISSLLHTSTRYTEEKILTLLQRKGSSLAEFIAHISAVKIIALDYQALKNYAAEILKDEDIIYIIFELDLDGTVIARHIPVENIHWPHPRFADQETFEDQRIYQLRDILNQHGLTLEYRQPIDYNAEKIGTITIGISRDKLLQVRENALQNLNEVKSSLAQLPQLYLKKFGYFLITLYALAFIFIGAVLYAMIKKLVIARLQKMTAVFGEVAEGNLGKRLEVFSGDEIGELCESFNQMTASLRKVTVSRDNLEESNTKLKQAQEALAEERAFLQKIIDSVVDPLMVINLDHEVELMNEAVKKNLPADLDRAIGMKCHLISHDSARPCATELHPCPLRQVITTGKAATTIHEHSLGEEKRFFELRASPLRDKYGNLAGIIEASRDVTQRIRNEEKLRQASITDELTGLLNRRGFLTVADKQIQVARREKREAFLLYADLDNMKLINDRLGHQTGDQALQDVAELLRQTFRESDVIGRLGGDEFAVLQPVTTGINGEQSVVKRLEEQITRLNGRPGKTYEISLSIGVVRFDPDNPATIDELLSRADSLMYKCKRDRKKSCRAGGL